MKPSKIPDNDKAHTGWTALRTVYSEKNIEQDKVCK